MKKSDLLNTLSMNGKELAEGIGLTYNTDLDDHYCRKKWGRGFRYTYNGESLSKEEKEYCKGLAVPPSWTDVIISKSRKNHILSFGYDEKKRKQYIYNEKWSEFRKLVDYYSLILLGENLDKIRDFYDEALSSEDDERFELGCILKILDSYYLRIGSETYLNKNGTIGLTTLRSDNLNVKEDSVELLYDAKSGQERKVSIDEDVLDDFLEERMREGGEVFKYWNSNKVNSFLKNFTNEKITAKDFRTWGGTFYAYKEMCERKDPKKKEVYEAAAEVLGNTPAIARSSYIHPDVVEAYGLPKYSRYFIVKKTEGEYERNLLNLLKRLFDEKWSLG